LHCRRLNKISAPTCIEKSDYFLMSYRAITTKFPSKISETVYYMGAIYTMITTAPHKSVSVFCWGKCLLSFI